VDEEKVLSVVSNLLANALKYAPFGGTVRCTVAGSADRVRIEVADSGPGVTTGCARPSSSATAAARAVPRARAAPASGLAIVRDLVALHNGMVTLTDAPEGGALFVVDLPINLDDGYR
jgi:signal transduction histidine kinase